jgi:hypothetical protein
MKLRRAGNMPARDQTTNWKETGRPKGLNGINRNELMPFIINIWAIFNRGSRTGPGSSGIFLISYNEYR